MSGATPLLPGVVLLHGLAGTSRLLRKMERALQRAGYATLNLDYASRKRPIEALVEDIHPAIAEFSRNVGDLHFVTHSMGGLLARAYLARYRPARLARVVMLGPPNNGSEVADLLKDLAPYRAFFGPPANSSGPNTASFSPDFRCPIVRSASLQATERSLPFRPFSSCRAPTTARFPWPAQSWKAWPTTLC
jgi:pimeloyl-ACP methyl ester carboxylesterase